MPLTRRVTVIERPVRRPSATFLGLVPLLHARKLMHLRCGIVDRQPTAMPVPSTGPRDTAPVDSNLRIRFALNVESVGEMIFRLA